MMRHPWTLYLAVGLGSLAATLLLTPLCRRLALRLDVVDRPGARKVHTRIVPYLGGLPFYFCFLGVILTLEVWRPEFSQSVLYPMALLGTIIVLMGLYDDARDMSSLAKLIVELIITLGLCFWGFRATQIAHPLGGVWQVGWLALIITPLWIWGVMNAVNFSDGLDGLAAGLVFICAAAIFAISWRANQVFSCVIMAYLMGTTLGFLRYNFHPASVFMGDTGALFLGFVLATSAMVQQQKGVTIIALAVPMVVIAVPIARWCWRSTTSPPAWDCSPSSSPSPPRITAFSSSSSPPWPSASGWSCCDSLRTWRHRRALQRPDVIIL